ncbi:hypothetical protein TWF281_004772 [Arthrobotrys megalospora]
MSTATRVLLLPELLEQILIYTFYAHKSEDDIPSLFLLRLRSVSIVWRSLIDTSPTIQTLTFRNPLLFNPGNPEGWRFNFSFEDWLADNMQIVAIDREGMLGKTRGRKDFERFAKGACTDGTGGLPWMYLTQPAVTEVSLYFSIEMHSLKMKKQWKEYRMSFCLSNGAAWRGDQLLLRDSKGITTRLVLEKVVGTLQALYSLAGPGWFALDQIVMRFGVDGKSWEKDRSYVNFEDCEAERMLWPLYRRNQPFSETPDT